MLELTESQLNGRFKLLPGPATLPGKCSVCGSAKRPVVDFDLYVEFYGAVVICVECFISAAEILDLVPGDKLRLAQLVQQNHEHEIKEAGRIANEYGAKLSDLLAEFAANLHGIYGSYSTEVHEISAVADESNSLPVEQKSEPAVIKRPPVLSGDSSNGFADF